MKYNKLLSSILAAMLIISAAAVPVAASADEVPVSVTAVESNSSKPAIESSGASSSDEISEYFTGSNINAQNYTNALRWANPINSYLVTCSDGKLMRFQNKDDYSGYLVEYFDSSYNRASSQLIEKELPIFGGFYSSDNYYIVITGQSNYDENDSTEVVRITKYDKSWNKLSSASLYGANTVEPFEAGSLRMDTCGNYLLIRTSHLMYKSSDGNNHQSNMTIEYDMNSSKITDSYTDIMNYRMGYISHSFNQFIKVENNKIVAVDHGDAHPRSIALVKYQTDVSNGKFVPDYFNTPCIVTDVVSIPGSTGQNDTGVAVGGFEISDSSYLVAGDIVADSSKYSSYSASRNIYVAAVSKSTNAVTMNLITNYTSSDSGVVNPQFVKIGNNRFLLLWSIKNDTSTVYYTEIDGNGNQVGDIHQMSGSLSDCAPSVINNKIVWYTWNYSDVVFYQIDVNNINNVDSKTVVYGEDVNPIVNNSSLSATKITVGSRMKINAAATGGSGSYTYSYYVRRKSQSSWYIKAENYTSSGIYFNVNYTGEYEVIVEVKDSKGNVQSKTLTFTAVDPVPELVNDSTVSATSAYINDKVVIKGAASGGSGDYKYAFYYKLHTNSDWILKGTEYGTATSVNLYPSKAAQYDIMVNAKDSDGTVVSKTFTLDVSQNFTNNSTISATAVNVGDKVTIKGTASGGSGGYKYAFYYKLHSNSTWTLKGTEYGSATTAYLYPSNAAQYDIMVNAKDSEGKVVSKTFTLDVRQNLTKNSTVSATADNVGDKVTIKGCL